MFLCSLAEEEGEKRSMNLDFNFDIREISKIDDHSQTLSIPMYFSVAWEEHRLFINESSVSWESDFTGPENVIMSELIKNLRLLRTVHSGYSVHGYSGQPRIVDKIQRTKSKLPFM